MGKRILTNKFGLPDTLVKAVTMDTHKNTGTISVTELIDGPRIRILRKQHDYETDVVDNLFALMGTALHHILERANIDSVRKRAFILTAETIMREADKITAGAPDKADQLKKVANYLLQLIPVFFPEADKRYIFERNLRLDLGSQVISGTFDLYDRETGILYDYKFCSTFAYTFPESRKKWAAQTNVYAYMLRQEGLPVNGIRVVAFFRDWNEHGLVRNKDYPDRQVKEIEIPLGSDDYIKKYIDQRIELHNRAESGDIPDCTGEDRWAKADEYAVKAPNSKKALRVLDSLPAANNYIIENQHKHDKMFIEKRPGGSHRCEKYCVVSAYCEQRKKELENEKLLNSNG